VIAKRIDHWPENDNFRALSLYVAGVGKSEDKILAKESERIGNEC